MKTVFKSSELPHIWALQQAPHGRCSSAISFNGGEYRSYSTPIANIHTTPTGEVVYFLNSSRYSNTTSKHQAYIRQAIPSFAIKFSGDVPNLSSPLSWVRGAIELAESCLQTAESVKLSHPRRKKQIAECESEAVHLLSQAHRVCGLFRIIEFAAYPWDSFDNIRAKVAVRAVEEAQEALKQEERYKAQREEEERQVQEGLQEWLRGERQLCPNAINKTYFRFNESGDLESSKGVTIERSEARSAIAFILSKRDAGWKRNGETYQIAGYHLDSVNEAGVVAGCHRFDWVEFDRVRGLLANA